MRKQEIFAGRKFILRALIFTLFGCSALAQTTVINTPSTDVLADEQTFIEVDFASHFDAYRRGGFQTYGYRMGYGLTNKLEVGANAFYTRNGTTSPGELQPNFKYKFIENEKHGVSVTSGAVVFVPLNEAAGQRPFGLVYSNVSKTVKKAGGMRVTGGIYKVLGTDNDFGSKRGVILGLEQPVTQKVKFVADWYSGKNRFGYSAAGVSYSITNRQFIFTGYNFGNSGRGNNFFSVFYGYSF